jgi:hypothetical protein
MARIPRPKHPQSKAKSIQLGAAPPREEVAFCFKYWRLTEKFCLTGCDQAYLAKLLERMRDMSGLRMRELMTSPPGPLRFHQINWSNSTEKSGYHWLHSQLQDLPPYQFSITANEYGVHGFVLGNVFHVVWLDREHRLLPNRV